MTTPGLTDRELRVIRMRFGLDGGPPRSLDDIGKLFGVTRERVRQMERRALSKLGNDARIKGLAKRSVANNGGKSLAQKAADAGSRGAKNASSKAGKTAGKQAGKKGASAASKGVPILDAAMLVSMVLELLVGPGQSEKGQDIALSAKTFEVALASLADLMANSNSWSGEASDAYNARNCEQMLRTVTIVALDRQLAAIVHGQAEKVHEVSIAMLVCSLSLIAAVPVAIALRAIPIVGPAISLAFQGVTAAAILAAEAAELGIMGKAASDNGAQMDTLTRQYRELGDNAHLNGSNTVMLAFSVGGQATTDVGDSPGTSSGAAEPRMSWGDVVDRQSVDARSVQGVSGGTAGQAAAAVQSRRQRHNTMSSARRR